MKDIQERDVNVGDTVAYYDLDLHLLRLFTITRFGNYGAPIGTFQQTDREVSIPINAQVILANRG